MSDPTPPTSATPPNDDGSGLPPRLLAKLKVEIEGYEPIERLGEGGQATVYKAIQKKDGKTVAVKVLHAGPHATEEARARLKREINALRAINHPNIVQAIAAGRTRSGHDCLVMNFVEGRPLDDLWRDSAFAAAIAPQPADVLRLFKVICETVQAAHRRGITHRDLSPSNILIDAGGQPHILDFGMASTAFDGIVTRDVTVTGQFIGKLKYASPEQARGARTPDAASDAAAGAGAGGVDIRSDVYALGVMLYQLLTGGAFPYEVVGNVIDVLHNIIHSKPRLPSETIAELHTPTQAFVVPAPRRAALPMPPAATVRRNPPLVNETIEAIVLKALEKDPAKRYQSAGELAADIDRYLAGQPTSAVLWSKRPHSQPVARPLRRLLIVAASVVFVVTLAGVTMNAKSLAVLLGLTAAVAPVLPSEVAPLAPTSVEAAALLAPPSDGSERGLGDLAADLARADARLRAVHKQLAASTSRKPPELDERQPGGSGPFPADEFLAALAKSANDTGRALKFPSLPQADRDRFEQEESKAVERETEAETLLSRRAAIDAEQASTWARLSWGTFTGREADKLYRFRLKTDPAADKNRTNKEKVVMAGVKVRRLAAKAMDDAATALRVPGGGEGGGGEGGGGGGADLGAVASPLAEQLRSELATFQTIAGTARDAGALTPEESAAVAELQKQADRLRDAVEGTAEMEAKAKKAEDELARFVARERLQRDLRDTADAASRLDAGLVKLAGEWKLEVDPAAPLGNLANTVARRPQPPARQPALAPRMPAANADVPLAVGETWTGTIKVYVGGTYRDQSDVKMDVVMRNGDQVELDWEMPAYGGKVRIEGTLVNGLLKGTYMRIIFGKFPPDNIGNSTIEARIAANGSSLVGGTYDVPGSNPRRTGTWELKRKSKPAAAAAGGPIAEIFPPDSTYTGRWKSETGWQNITATVTQVRGGIATVRWDNDFGVWDSQMEVVGNRIKMRTCTGIGRSKQGRALSEITNIEMTGPSDAAAHAGTVRITGTWDWFNHESRTGKRGVATALELDRK